MAGSRGFFSSAILWNQLVLPLPDSLFFHLIGERCLDWCATYFVAVKNSLLHILSHLLVSQQVLFYAWIVRCPVVRDDSPCFWTTWTGFSLNVMMLFSYWVLVVGVSYIKGFNAWKPFSDFLHCCYGPILLGHCWQHPWCLSIVLLCLPLRIIWEDSLMLD